MKAITEINVKIGKRPYRIKPGQTVPAEVENFWSKKQKEDLLKAGAISDGKLSQMMNENSSKEYAKEIKEDKTDNKKK